MGSILQYIISSHRPTLAMRSSIQRLLTKQHCPAWSPSRDFSSSRPVLQVAMAAPVSYYEEDQLAMQTTARRAGDDLVINGRKMWITNAFQADWICLLANTEEGPAHLNKSLVCVPMNTPGIHLAKRIDKMGMRGSDTA